MLCIDAFYGILWLELNKGSNHESELAIGFIECMNKMGKPPNVCFIRMAKQELRIVDTLYQQILCINSDSINN